MSKSLPRPTAATTSECKPPVALHSEFSAGKRRLRILPTVAILAVSVASVDANQDASRPRFSSQVVSARMPGHAVEIDIDIKGATKLFLVVRDGGDGFGCDWADWVEPRLVGPAGEKKLTDLKWKSATADWGRTRINRNAAGDDLLVNGRVVKYGIGTHANSVITYDLPSGFVRFKARGALDNGGTDQGCGSTVQFQVYVDALPARVARASRGWWGRPVKRSSPI